MSYQKINPLFLNRTIDIKRVTTAKNLYGGLTKSTTVVYNGIKANIQEKENKQETNDVGDQTTRTHIAFLDNKVGNVNLVLNEGDELLDRASNLTYGVVGVKRFYNKAGEVHHFQLDLECLGENPVSNQLPMVSAKASITH